MKEERSQIADKAPFVIPSEARDLGSSHGRQRPRFSLRSLRGMTDGLKP